jgi:O-antigen/teichoic acid export membrane protein
VPIAFGIWAIAPDAVGLAGDGYADAAPVLRVLIFVLIPIFLDFPVGSLLNAADKQSTKTAVMGVTMVINVVANAILIPMYGTMGAAFSAVISFFFLFFGGVYFVPTILPSYRSGRLARVVGPIVLCGLVMGLVCAALRPYLSYVLVVPIGGVAYVALLFATKSIPKHHLDHALAILRRNRAPDVSS